MDDELDDRETEPEGVSEPETEAETEAEAPAESAAPDYDELTQRLDKVLAGIDGMQRTLAALIAANGGGAEEKAEELSIDDVTPDDDFDFDFE